MKTHLLFPLFLSACGTGLAGTWETTAVPAGTTSFSEYKQTLTIRSDNKFTKDIKATHSAESPLKGCIVTIIYEGTWTEPKGGTLRFVAVDQKGSTSSACSDPAQNYLEDDKPASGAAALPQEVEYKLQGSTLDLLISSAPYISYKRKQ